MTLVTIIMFLFIKGVRSEINVGACRADKEQVQCGDQCMGNAGHCHCGNKTINILDSREHCCIQSNETCYLEYRYPHNGYCRDGEVRPMSIPCNNEERNLQCFNSYQDSPRIRNKDSYYTCPNICVPVGSDMCQGVSWCENDVEECGPHLRCEEKPENTSLTVAREHHFCMGMSDKAIGNNGIFDKIDRSDESLLNSDSSHNIYATNITQFKPCSIGNSTGLTCGTECNPSQYWCMGYGIFLGFSTLCGKENVSTGDKGLCGNPLIWKNVSCDQYNSAGVKKRYGMRCQGTYQACVTPWYNVFDGDGGANTITLPSCQDKSDQIFPIGSTCDNLLKEKIAFHDLKFCNNPEFAWLKSRTICKNKTQWLEEMAQFEFLAQGHQKTVLTTISKVKDPHFCQLSCSEPRSDCNACTNKEYFNCTRSGQCVHPELVCDGHPQCSEGEDEDLIKCHLKYIKNQIVQPFASYKCKSLFYPKMDIYATPCNKIKECFDYSDENNCEEGSLMTKILLAASFAVIFVYVSLKIYQNINEENVDHMLMASKQEISPLGRYETDHDNPNVISEVNLYLLRKILTQNLDTTKNMCIQFYDLEVRIHGGMGSINRDSEIFMCLHNKLHPKIIQNLVDAKFPGIMAKIITMIETKILRKRYITFMMSKFRENEQIANFLSLISRMIAIVTKYLDQFKDTALTFWILGLVGGFQSIIDLKTNFTSVIILIMASSIIIPLLLSSIHLVVNNLNLMRKFYGRVGSTSTFAKTVFCILYAPITPILITNSLESATESTRKLIRFYDHGIENALRKCMKMKIQLLKFLKIELGKKYKC